MRVGRMSQLFVNTDAIVSLCVRHEKNILMFIFYVHIQWHRKGYLMGMGGGG